MQKVQLRINDDDNDTFNSENMDERKKETLFSWMKVKWNTMWKWKLKTIIKTINCCSWENEIIEKFLKKNISIKWSNQWQDKTTQRQRQLND